MIFSLDLGQAADFTALSAVKLLPPAKPGEGRIHHLLNVKRYVLGTSYTDIVDEVGTICNAFPSDPRPVLVIDGSGVGRPVVDMFRKSRINARVLPVTITGGLHESFEQGYFHVAKQILVSTIQVLLQQKRLKMANFAELAVAQKELRDFRVKISKAANEIYSAREGAHDDIVLSIAQACWWGERGGRSANVW